MQSVSASMCWSCSQWKNHVSLRMQLESRIYPGWASLHKATCVFVQPGRSQVWLHGWNIPVPKAERPARLLCISCVSHSNIPAFLPSHAPGFFPSKSSLTCGKLWGPEGGCGWVREGLGWLRGEQEPRLGHTWGFHPALGPESKLTEVQEENKHLRVCGASAKERSPLNFFGLKAQRVEFPCLRGTGSSYFSIICNTVDLGSYINFLSWYNNAVLFIWPVVYLTLGKVCFILRSSNFPCFLIQPFIGWMFPTVLSSNFFFFNLNQNF